MVNELWFGSYEPLDNPLMRLKAELSIGALRKIASSKNVEDRINLTDYPFPLPDEIFFRLVEDNDDVVRSLAPTHRSATTEQLERLLALRPEIFASLIDHSNAPLVAFENRPIEHTDGPDRRRYLDLILATPQQRSAFLAACTAAELDGRATLGSVWAKIVAQASAGELPRG